jgi:hypothetical protein
LKPPGKELATRLCTAGACASLQWEARVEMELLLLCEKRDGGVPDDQRESAAAQDAVLAMPSGVLEQLERLRLAATAGQRKPERSVIAKDTADPV